MANQKKNSSKKSAKSKSGSAAANAPEMPFFWIVVGWLSAAVGALILLGGITSACSGGAENWLGPYLGDLLPGFSTYVFGRVGAIFLSFSLVFWGVCIAVPAVREKLLRIAIGCSLLTFDLSFLLALKSYGEPHPSSEALSLGGGAVGHFFSQYVLLPVFGPVSILAPLIVLLTGLGLILVLSFGLRPRHFRFLAQAMAWFFSLFGRKSAAPETDEEGEEDDSDDEDPVVNRRGVSMMSDETMLGNVNDYKILRKNKIKPFSGRNNWLEGEADFTAPAPAEFAPAQDARQAQQDENTLNTPPVADAAEYDPQQGDPEIARLEDELRRNEGRMNALEIMEIKDRIAALRRARDLINWEKAHPSRLVVKGAVRGGSNTREVETLAAQPVPPSSDAPTVMDSPDFENDPTVAPASNPEDLLGGEPTRYDEPAADDETFYPEVVSADEVGRDPTYVPPNRIGTAESTGIPQPDPTQHYDEYKIPTVDEILDAHAPQPADYTEEELNEIGRMLEEKLENFKVKGKVVGCETGPVITRFEVEPGPGVKVNQFSSLQDDLAMALKATSIRILTPIPGKGAVGIEIPNRKTQTIYGRDIFESAAFKPSPDKIVMALGKDISGEPFAMDLAKAPHLMIAGQTGSGKSVCINALMASMLLSKTPDELRMILVDPKAVELKMYENIPHLLAPVITKPEIAIQALQWLCYEMDRRTEVLAKAKVRNLLGFNEKFEAGELPDDVPEEDRNRRMAFIVVIIDEMADLMMVAGKEIEKNVSRLAAKARAVGIHLVLATQRPSVKVITGNIKANLPTRISFKVASQVDARTVMDHAGAEKLLGRGDMLYKAVNAPDPIRLHGAFLSDEEAEKLADACSNQNVCYPQLESFDVVEDGGDDDDDGNAALNEKKDKLLFEVAKWAIECGNGLSTSAVQRHFSVGYSRAGKIVDQLFGLGLCARSTGNSKPRAMLIDMDQLMQLERSGTFR
ncbi:MAG: DNA translocase FtsK [Fibrobacter sp.]|nr:DNA translocase FtsK [Fibrobacter sp.]